MHLRFVKAIDLKPLPRVLATNGVQQGGERLVLGQVIAAVGKQQEERQFGEALRQAADDRECVCVGPVEVVQEEGEGTQARQRGQEGDDAVNQAQAVFLRAGHRLRRGLRQPLDAIVEAGHDLRHLRQAGGRQKVQRLGGNSVEVTPQHIGQGSKRQVLLNGLARGADDRGAGIGGLLKHPHGQACFAHARFALEHDERTAAAQCFAQAVAQRVHFLFAPHQQVGVAHVDRGHEEVLRQGDGGRRRNRCSRHRSRCRRVAPHGCVQQRRRARGNIAIENALMPLLREGAGVGPQFIGQNRATALIGQQCTGAVARLGLVAHERLIGILAHLIARQDQTRGADSLGVVPLQRLNFGQLQQAGEVALAQPVALCGGPVGVGVAHQIVILVERDRLLDQPAPLHKVAGMLRRVQPLLKDLHIEPDLRVDVKGVAWRLRHDVTRGRAVGALWLEHVAQGVDCAAQRGGRGVGRALRPEDFDETIRGDGARPFGDQDLEQLARLARMPVTLGNQMIAAHHLQRAEGEDLNLRLRLGHG